MNFRLISHANDITLTSTYVKKNAIVYYPTAIHFHPFPFDNIYGYHGSTENLFNLSYPSLAILITIRSYWISFFIQLGTGFKVAPTTRDGPHLCYTIHCMSLPPFHSQYFMNPPPVPTHKSLWGSEKYLFLECINECEALTAFCKKHIVFTRYHFLLFLPFTFFT